MQIECNGVALPEKPKVDKWTHGPSLIVSKEIDISVKDVDPGITPGSALEIVISRRSTGVWNRAADGIRRYVLRQPRAPLPMECETQTDIRYWPKLDECKSREVTCGYCLLFDPRESGSSLLAVKGVGKRLKVGSCCNSPEFQKRLTGATDAAREAVAQRQRRGHRV